MEIERHNWKYISGHYECLLCDAIVPSSEQISNYLRGHNSTMVYAIDYLWHTKYRPMAGLCLMVEEANG